MNEEIIVNKETNTSNAFFHISEITRYVNDAIDERHVIFDSAGIDNYHMYFSISNELEIRTSTSVHKLSESNLIIFKPEGKIKLSSPHNANYIHCIFSGKCVDEILTSLNLSCNIIYPISVSYKTGESYLLFTRQLEHIISEFNRKDQYHKTVIPCMFIEFLALCSKNIASESDTQNIYYIQKVISYIRDNIRKDIDINVLCQMTHLSKSRFYAIFKKYTGVSPLKFQNNYRITAAADYLVLYNMKIKEVCEFMGYKDPLYFSKLFKRNFGISPSEYVKYKKAKSKHKQE